MGHSCNKQTDDELLQTTKPILPIAPLAKLQISTHPKNARKFLRIEQFLFQIKPKPIFSVV